MSDIVERLRRWTHAADAAPACDLMDEAADEIARLRLTNEEPSAASAGSLANRTIQHNGEAAADWISVTDRLPDRNEPVLVVDESGVTVGTYSPTFDDWWSLHGDRLAPGPCVTHWMPLPAPPTDAK